MSLQAVGDVFIDSPLGADVFAPLRPVLSLADIVFGNCEGFYSDRPAPAPTHKHLNGAALERGAGLHTAPFHVMTLANNHILDGGYPGLTDTLELLRRQDIRTTGAGSDLGAATSPAILVRDGVRFAFLGFCSVFPHGYEARPGRPGLAPLRVDTAYRAPDPNFWEPGMEPVIVTVAQQEDLARLRAAVALAREVADVVVVAHHWGNSSVLEDLFDYEITLARHTIDVGADAVLCHHHHSLRGMEFHAGRPIFYGLGTLVHHFHEGVLSQAARAARQAKFGARSSFTEEETFARFPFAPAARMTGVAVLEVDVPPGPGDPVGSVRAGFIPAMMLADGRTEPLTADDPRADKVLAYVQRLTADGGFDVSFTRRERSGWAFLSCEPAVPG